MGDIKSSDKKVAYPALRAELAKIDGLDSSLKTWRKAYNAIGGGPQNPQEALSSLYTSTAELAFKLKNYKQAIDRVLKDNPSSTVQGARTGYQETLDGFIVSITNGILIGQKLLG